MTFTNILALAFVFTIFPRSLAYPATTTSLSRQVRRQATNALIPKAGLAWGNGNTVDITQYQSTGKVSWYYSWSPNAANSDLEFSPMLWGGGDKLAQFTSTISSTISQNNVTAVLGMNEPEQAAQSNLTPQQATDIWKANLEPLRAQGLRLGSPATSSAPSAKTWMQDFLAACVGCTVDFVALHWYGVNATQFISYIEDFHNTFQRPLWITEWSCHNFVDANLQCSQDDVVLFLNQTQSYMDNADFVERYAWFGAMKDLHGVNPLDALMDTDGKINSLGQQYIGATPPQVDGIGSSNGPTSPTSGSNSKSSGGFAPSKNAQQKTSVSFAIFFSVFVLMCTVA